jgi:hypothetical protein
MIRKSSLRAKARPKPKKKKPRSKPKTDIAAAKALLDGLKAPTPQAAKVLALLKTWLEDESGYDEETWPELKKALDAERDRVGARRLFDG